ncbi:uncharacterized protein N7503_009138 [Penicillium pulvis]|uniref:uncharacterized protein n=1 Tax=Penicillium pulvis TaxID=1562058 RepID=UPI002546A0D2|nr:uncharacterized protein N7503_009138 [Penicillium pulvis]KAJ5793160.1 hypothetical protein N7503_009138 [Penicillium pulvis]
MAPARSSRPVRQSRTQVSSYHEETTSDELDQDVSRRGSLSLRPRNTPKNRRSYREKSTDESLGELSDDDELNDAATATGLPAAEQVPGASPTIPHALKRTRRAATSRSTPNKRPRPKSRALGQPLKKRSKAQPEEPFFLGSGVIPPWQTLPYHILIEIFLLAFYPLDDPKNQAAKKTPGKTPETKSTHNLLGIAALCRGFSEAALAALYYRPPVFSAYDGHGLLNLLSMPLDSQFINYAGKIRELYIDAETVLTLKSGPTLGYFDLLQLLQKTPRLHTLRLYHPEDVVLGLPRVALTLAKWSYSQPLFSTIDQSGIKIRSWEWNGRFLDTASLLPLMLEKHTGASFQGVKDIRLVHLLDHDREDTAAKETALATTLKALPEIERLEFYECSILAGSILEQLPPTLRSLTISNCDRLLASNVTELLKVHGGQLLDLTLNHNRHMNLEFMPHLGICCPRLERFKVDISMYDVSSYHDLDPHFQQLIFRNQHPTWPETIQEIELYQLRHWKLDLAEMFFMSLVESAPKLKDLRRVDISAILPIEWRDRAQFRKKWDDRFKRVFLRRSPPPNPDFRSLRKRPLAPVQRAPTPEASARPGTADSETLTPKRHSSRIAQQKIPEDTDLDEVKSSHSDTDTQSADKDDVQGMCEHFTIRIDNQRPNENQYNEKDFLDPEISGDEDWDSGADFESEDGHAW